LRILTPQGIYPKPERTELKNPFRERRFSYRRPPFSKKTFSYQWVKPTGHPAEKLLRKNDALPGIIPLPVKEMVAGKVESPDASDLFDFYALFLFSLFSGFRSLHCLVDLGLDDS
jgi:hypothetical protein